MNSEREETTTWKSPFDNEDEAEEDDHVGIKEPGFFDQECNGSTESLIDTLDDMFTRHEPLLRLFLPDKSIISSWPSPPGVSLVLAMATVLTCLLILSASSSYFPSLFLKYKMMQAHSSPTYLYFPDKNKVLRILQLPHAEHASMNSEYSILDIVGILAIPSHDRVMFSEVYEKKMTGDGNFLWLINSKLCRPNLSMLDDSGHDFPTVTGSEGYTDNLMLDNLQIVSDMSVRHPNRPSIPPTIVLHEWLTWKDLLLHLDVLALLILSSGSILWPVVLSSHRLSSAHILLLQICQILTYPAGTICVISITIVAGAH
ncbi:hypothetical protein EDD22DRAFT_849781 [Suillus occidentalis]|nr:hypothetical protein EDD22DRAFT_849781 [Suillus occidentalis]